MDRRQRAKGIRGGAFKGLARPHQVEEARHRRSGKGLAEEEVRGRLGLPAVAQGIWRARRDTRRARDLAAGGGRLLQADKPVPDRRRHVRADADGLWQRSRQTTLSAENRFGRGNLVPAVLGAIRRIRRRGPAHPRRARRRPLGHQRPEDLDLRRALLRLWHSHHPHRSRRAQAQGPDHVLHRHEERRRRGQADQAGQRDAGVQRGVLHELAHSGQAAARRGRRRLERVADDADERADDDRCPARDRLLRAVRFLLQPDDRGRARDRRSRHALETRQLGGEKQRPEIHQLPGDLGAFQR